LRRSRKEEDTEFNLLHGIKMPLALASMAGITDVDYALKFEGDIGLAFIGGFSIDEKTMEASRKMAERGRREFIFDDPIRGVKDELKKSAECDFKIGVNVRAVETDAYVEIAGIARKYDAIVEINAHCRQPEIVELGAGQALMLNLNRLGEIVKAVREEDAIVSVKFRSGVVDERKVVRLVEDAGADMVHVDAMGRDGYDLTPIRRIRNFSSIFLIGNNSIRTVDDALRMFSSGADMVSVARGSLSGNIFRGIREKIEEIEKLTGWYNVPAHICRGGDIRALTFCCKPVKSCPLQNVLKNLSITPSEFIKLNKGIVHGS